MRKLVLAVVALVSASVAQAGPVVPGHVAADAKWFGHVNVEKIRSLPMMQECKAKWQADSRCQEHVQAMAEKLGMNPMEDLLGITLYSTQYEGEVGVCLFYVKAVDKKKMVAFFKEKCPDHETMEYGDRTLYRWTAKHGSKEMKLTGAFASKTLIVIGADTKHVQAALDVLDGKEDGLEKDAKLLAGVSKKAMFVSRAVDVPEDYRKTTKCPVLRNCTEAFAQWTENEGQIKGEYRFTTDSEDTARNYKAIVEGFVAMAKLHCGDNEAAMKVIDGLKCTAKGDAFVAVWKTTTEDVHAAMEQVMKHMGKHPHATKAKHHDKTEKECPATEK
jgi:hypothetical protein